MIIKGEYCSFFLQTRKTHHYGFVVWLTTKKLLMLFMRFLCNRRWRTRIPGLQWKAVKTRQVCTSPMEGRRKSRNRLCCIPNRVNKGAKPRREWGEERVFASLSPNHSRAPKQAKLPATHAISFLIITKRYSINRPKSPKSSRDLGSLPNVVNQPLEVCDFSGWFSSGIFSAVFCNECITHKITAKALYRRLRLNCRLRKQCQNAGIIILYLMCCF